MDDESDPGKDPRGKEGSGAIPKRRRFEMNGGP